MMLRRLTQISYCFLVLLGKALPGLAVTCHRAEYLIGDQCCPMCNPGTRVKKDCTDERSTSCQSCTSGTYMNKPTGLKDCFLCATCDADSGLRVKWECSSIIDVVCEPLEGFYCVDPQGDGCLVAQRHKKCKPGQYISKNGTALTDSVCSDCSAGTFSDGTFTSCRPHTQCESINRPLMKEGTASADAECGEENSNTTAIVIAVVVSSSIVAVLIVAAVLIWKKKSKGDKIRRKEEKEFSVISGGHKVAAGSVTLMTEDSLQITESKDECRLNLKPQQHDGA